MTNQDSPNTAGATEPVAFQREERFIVIKRKHLNAVQETSIRTHMARLGIGMVECVVVESDWPEYEVVWKMIEDRAVKQAAMRTRSICSAPGCHRTEDCGPFCRNRN